MMPHTAQHHPVKRLPQPTMPKASECKDAVAAVAQLAHGNNSSICTLGHLSGKKQDEPAVFKALSTRN